MKLSFSPPDHLRANRKHFRETALKRLLVVALDGAMRRRGLNNRQITERLNVPLVTRWRWGTALRAGGFAGLYPGVYRSGRKPKPVCSQPACGAACGEPKKRRADLISCRHINHTPQENR